MTRIDEIINNMTFEEKAELLTGAVASMSTSSIERFGIKAKKFADGPHGIRKNYEDKCTNFPCLSLVAATFDVELIEEMGKALAKDCIENDVDMLLGPGINIKRTPLCGRNFEYFSEDPHLTGEIAAAYVNGMQSLGVGACVKHFAVNNQERYRQDISVDVDLRTLMEIYLKAFEIVITKASPQSIMCAYNKLHSIWCSENKYLLTEVLRDMWSFKGFVMSDWGAVKNSPRAIAAGLDLQMPRHGEMSEALSEGLKEGLITEAEIDNAVRRVLKFLTDRPEKEIKYNRDEQHLVAQKVAADGIVLLKNDESTLPLTKEKYKNIAIIGEFAKSPLINGQGSAEVKTPEEYIDCPLAEIQKRLDGVNITYMELYSKTAFSEKMLWPEFANFDKFTEDADLVLMFIGSMESEDTEKLDRRTSAFNPNYEMFIERALEKGKKVAVVIQSGSAMSIGDWRNDVGAIVQMWLGGEGAGGGVADVLTGIVNPSGKLSETFPTKDRCDLQYPGTPSVVEYNEKFMVGYRYYDLHPEEIAYPFGHGLSYTEFEYSNLKAEASEGTLKVSLNLTNTGEREGKEVVQLYIGSLKSTVARPVKELKAFKKIKLNKGETKKVEFEIAMRELGYYNVLLKEWVTEPGEYVIYAGSSSRDIRLEKRININCPKAYSLNVKGEDMIG